MFAHLRDIQKELGKDKFPLIDQQYFPDHKEMVGFKLIEHFKILSLALRLQAASSPVYSRWGMPMEDLERSRLKLRQHIK